MSRQNKQVKKAILARSFTQLHLRGERGPKSTTPKHSKSVENRIYSVYSRAVKSAAAKNAKEVGAKAA